MVLAAGASRDSPRRTGFDELLGHHRPQQLQERIANRALQSRRHPSPSPSPASADCAARAWPPHTTNAPFPVPTCGVQCSPDTDKSDRCRAPDSAIGASRSSPRCSSQSSKRWSSERGDCSEPRQDHGVKLQALGLVDGHELQPIAGVRVGLSEQRVHLLAEPFEIGQIRALRESLQQIEISSRVFECSFILHAGGTAEPQPRRLPPNLATAVVRARRGPARSPAEFAGFARAPSSLSA